MSVYVKSRLKEEETPGTSFRVLDSIWSQVCLLKACLIWDGQKQDDSPLLTLRSLFLGQWAAAFPHQVGLKKAQGMRFSESVLRRLSVCPCGSFSFAKFYSIHWRTSHRVSAGLPE